MSTLALLEPISPKATLDRPSLGCAMLLASCRNQGIKTVLIKSQTRFLREMFVFGQEELWDLISGLKKSDLDEFGISDYRQSIVKKGFVFFREELKELYWYFFRKKNLRSYCDTFRINKFETLYILFMAVIAYYINRLGRHDLSLVDNYIKEIIKADPGYVGFSLDQPDPYSFAIRKRLKEKFDIPLIVGGSFTPFLRLDQIRKLLKDQFADYLVVGPAEYSLPALLGRIDAGKSPEGISNVFYVKNGRLKYNPLKEITDLDSLACPDFSQFDLDGYLSPERLLPLQTARGCSWQKCAFCDYHRNTFGTLRMFGIKRVVENIVYLRDRYQCHNFSFHDDDFPPCRARQFSRKILSRKLMGLNFYQYARFERGFNDNDTLRLMRKAGFSLIKWGMESGSQRVLDLMYKGTKVQVAGQILKKSHRHGILNHCMAFFGFPGETRKEACETVNFLKRHSQDIDSVEFKPFVLSEFSRVAADPRKFGIDLKRGNNYTLKNGMSLREAADFSQELKQKTDVAALQIYSSRLRLICDQKGYQRFLLLILLSGQRIFSLRTIIGRPNNKRLETVHPLVLGSLEKKKGASVYLPQDICDSLFINMLHPPGTISLDRLQVHLVSLSDGSHTLREIIASAPAGRGALNKKRAADKIIRFLNELLRCNFALVLERKFGAKK